MVARAREGDPAAVGRPGRGGAPATSVVTVDLKVDKARVIGDEWRATLLVGTLNHSEAAQLGCGYSEAELAVRARLAQ